MEDFIKNKNDRFNTSINIESNRLFRWVREEVLNNQTFVKYNTLWLSELEKIVGSRCFNKKFVLVYDIENENELYTLKSMDAILIYVCEKNSIDDVKLRLQLDNKNDLVDVISNPNDVLFDLEDILKRSLKGGWRDVFQKCYHAIRRTVIRYVCGI